ATGTPLRPSGDAPRATVEHAFGARAKVRGAGGDVEPSRWDEHEMAARERGEEQRDDEDEEQQEEAPADEEQQEEGGEEQAEEEGPSDNLSETEALLKDIPMPVVVELGRIKTTAGDIVNLRAGQILEL